MSAKTFFEKTIIQVLPKRIKNHIIFLKEKENTERYFQNSSYSQEGEDILLERLFEREKSGFYVDVGAHHPFRFSNTYKFYQKGWRGINIDAMPGSMDLFHKERPGDVNLEMGISNEETTLIFYIFNEPALNTFSKKEAEERNGRNGYFITDEVPMETKRLSYILKNFLPPGIRIDMMNVDVEGLDLEVLRSNDWETYKPKVILVEEYLNSIEALIDRSEIYRYLTHKNYRLYGRTCNTSVYRLNELHD